MAKSAPYFVLHLNKQKDRTLIRWLVGEKTVFESAAGAAKQKLYGLMEQEREKQVKKEQGR